MMHLLVLGNGAAGAEKQALALARMLQSAISSKKSSLSTRISMCRVPYTSSFVHIPPALHIGAAAMLQQPLLGYNPPLPTQFIPHVVIGCGRSTVALCAGLKMAHPSIFNTQIQHPRTDLKYFNAVIAPEHDFHDKIYQESRVYLTKGTITDVNPQLLDLWEGSDEWIQWSDPKIALLVGGSCRGYEFNVDRAKALVKQMKVVVPSEASILATFSRRTPAKVQEYLRKALYDSFERVSLYNGIGTNPYLGYLKHASSIITTPDSISMTTEALCSAKPVIVFDLERCQS
ncbi:hypothetical protein THRCLA_09899, partial [Thraustotheca clavata]